MYRVEGVVNGVSCRNERFELLKNTELSINRLERDWASSPSHLYILHAHSERKLPSIKHRNMIDFEFLFTSIVSNSIFVRYPTPFLWRFINTSVSLKLFDWNTDCNGTVKSHDYFSFVFGLTFVLFSYPERWHFICSNLFWYFFFVLVFLLFHSLTTQLVSIKDMKPRRRLGVLVYFRTWFNVKSTHNSSWMVSKFGIRMSIELHDWIRWISCGWQPSTFFICCTYDHEIATDVKQH